MPVFIYRIHKKDGSGILEFENWMYTGIRLLPEKKIIGMKLKMSFTENRTVILWRSFMPRRKEIRNAISDELYSIQIYNQDFNFTDYDLQASFEKWAGMEVSDFGSVPEGMESLVLETGLYAVFIHKGPASHGEKTFRYIFGEWMPRSGYKVDARPHFEVLGENYKNEDPSSEEEVWIPVKPVNFQQ